MARYRPDVVHLASPASLGHQAAEAAAAAWDPDVAVQTDLVGFARERYPSPGAAARWPR